jgi:photosystem II stability/assembly factor-like uncharacterized protein
MKALRTLGLLLLIPLVTRSQNFTTSTWQSVGPEGGYLSGLVQNPVSGDLFTVVYEYPTRVFKSTNNGDTWNVIGQIQDSYITFLGIDSQTPATMYAVPSYLGYESDVHIYKTVNGGLTWSKVTFAGQSSTNYYTQSFHVDKQDPKKLSVVGETYLSSIGTYGAFNFWSTDGGATWSLKTYANVSTDPFVALCAETDPSDPNTQYVAGYLNQAGYSTPKLFKTTNNGTSWTEIGGTTIQSYVYDLLIDPSSPNKVYAANSSSVYRSTDKGASWKAANSGYPYGYKLLFDPRDYSTIYVYNCGLACYRSSDGGQTWSTIGSGLSGSSCNQLVVSQSSSSIVYAATRSGFFRSTNGGQSWTSSNAGLLASEIPMMKCAPSSPKTLYISFLNSGLYKTSNALGKASQAAMAAISWQKMPEYSYCEGIMGMQVSPTDPNVLYVQEGAG